MKKELLIKLRDRVKDQFETHSEICSGLCLEINLLARDGNITEEEQEELRSFIYNHRPTKGKHFDPGQKYDAYFWPVRIAQPRLDWLNYCIKYYWFIKFKS